MIATTINPPLTDDLTDRLIDIWVATTNAGGSVGFVGPVTRAHIESEVAGFWDQRLDGVLDLVVAVDGPTVLGFGFLQPGTGVSAHVGEISKLQRDPSAAGRGVGAMLLTALEDLAVARGLTLVTLTVREGTGRESYYHQHGYESVAVLPGWLRIAGQPRALQVMAKPVGADAGRSVHDLARPPTGSPLAPGSPAATAPPAVPAGGPGAPRGAGLRLAVQRLDPELPLPAYAQPGDAGLDLHARRRMVLPPGTRGMMPTGLAVAIPDGYVGLVHPRSGLAIKRGLSIINTPGTIDAGYRGELRVPLINLDPSATIRLERGDRIAQLLIQRVEHALLVEVDELPDGVRGAGGFGSTGR